MGCLGAKRRAGFHWQRQDGRRRHRQKIRLFWCAGFFNAERAAVDLVEEYLERFELDVDRHSDGHTYVAHRPEVVQGLKAYGQSYTDRYGLPFDFIPQKEMTSHGMNSASFFGAVQLPIGFALNPLKFALGLTSAAEAAGMRIFTESPVQPIEQHNGHMLRTPDGIVHAKNLLIATNGYSTDDLPDAFAGRYLPVQSNVLVTRPITVEEQQAQGW